MTETIHFEQWQFSDYALAFTKAAANGPATFPKRLLKWLRDNPKTNPSDLAWRIQTMQNKNKKKLPFKRAAYSHNKFEVVPTTEGVNIFSWECMPRKRGADEKNAGNTKITLHYIQSTQNWEITIEGAEQSVKDRAAAALGQDALRPYQRQPKQF